MITEHITIPVDTETARAYAAASKEERRKMQLLLRLRLQELTTSPTRPLKEILEDIGRKAEARGLTPEVLESLLHDK